MHMLNSGVFEIYANLLIALSSDAFTVFMRVRHNFTMLFNLYFSGQSIVHHVISRTHRTIKFNLKTHCEIEVQSLSIIRYFTLKIIPLLQVKVFSKSKMILQKANKDLFMFIC